MIIKKFKLFEAQQRLYGGGNLFSNNHRDPNLPASCAMIDIDNIEIYNGQITGIIEDKYKFDSDFLGNPLSGKGTWQRGKLIDICNRIGCPLYFYEQSTGDVYQFQNNQANKVNLDEKNVIVKTDNVVYVEIRYGKPVAIMYRTEGKKADKLNVYDKFTSTLILSERLGIPIYLVNDVMGNDRIYIKKMGKDNPTHLIISSNPDDWTKVYTELKLI